MHDEAPVTSDNARLSKVVPNGEDEVKARERESLSRCAASRMIVDECGIVQERQIAGCERHDPFGSPPPRHLLAGWIEDVRPFDRCMTDRPFDFLDRPAVRLERSRAKRTTEELVSKVAEGTDG